MSEVAESIVCILEGTHALSEAQWRALLAEWERRGRKTLGPDESAAVLASLASRELR